ncbi:hypothetical protein [Thermoflexibacter ruber]|uniref:ABC-2 type transport system permease protein n=1 Tax=Thermoflexibacter ruber TaxID=1003 RepID=A0A1I2F6T3_9BACT|nr:hypothetical protein [Thermoflexibacter ruber]SFF00326.1 hypothetical protein SAMN04488541_101289 [Thermoflexibacter ruber]
MFDPFKTKGFFVTHFPLNHTSCLLSKFYEMRANAGLFIEMLLANQKNNMTTVLFIGLGIVIYALLFKSINWFEKM